MNELWFAKIITGFFRHVGSGGMPNSETLSNEDAANNS